MHVVADGVSVIVDGTTILHAATLHAQPGKIVGVVGPNGSGKSTLLKVIYRAWQPAAGSVLVDDQPIWSLRPKQAARLIGVLQQADHSDFEFSVEEVVALGRLPHQGLIAHADHDDRAIVADAIARCGITHLRHRQINTLSGGERQRVLIARSLAQQPQLLILDEPSNHLDIGSQLELLDLIGSLGITVVTALHDLNLALAHCDDIVVLHAGHVLAAGPAADVLTTELVNQVYGVASHRGTHPLTGKPHLSFAARDTNTTP
ncbi:MAG TPA: ABC transporter ATP-binding protein [Ilumatobacter sp.]|nr:ABC transporter ATP-binding protein [Ilumatobacter sp.]